MKSLCILPLLVLLSLANAAPAAGQSPFDGPAVAPEFSAVRSSSVYVPMKDGTRIAVEVVLPQPLPPGRTLPALLKIAQFGRAPVDGSVTGEERFWTGHGYARVLVDQRGTGASFGTIRFGGDMVSDLREVVDWIVKQPWSNGRAGAIGTSVEGTASELLAATGHPAVRAVAPWSGDYNYYTDLVRPGGVYDEWLLEDFQNFSAEANGGPDAKPVDGDTGGALLRAAVAEHAHNVDIHAATKAAEFLDDPLAGGDGRSLLDLSIFGVRAALKRSHVPMLILAAWFDAGTVQGALQRFREFDNDQHLVIGAWSHGAAFNANPFLPATEPVVPSREQQWMAALRFFDGHLKTGAAPPAPSRRIDYFTIGANEWQTTTVWPPKGTQPRTYYLEGGSSLGTAPSTENIEVELAQSTTGDDNRWHTQLGGQPVLYGKALARMLELAHFSTAPLTGPLALTGQAILRLRIATARTDPSLFAYLVAIDPQGKPLYLTEGQLRLLHRQADAAQQTLHTYQRRDAQPLAADTTTDVVMTLLPFSAVIPRGSKLELLLAGSDTSAFAATGGFKATVYPGSRIVLPAVRRAGPIDLPVDQWREDLQFFANEMPRRHADAFHHTPRAQFDAEIAALDQRLGEMDSDQIYVALNRIDARIGDGHTYITIPEDAALFPIDLARFGEDIDVVAIAPPFEQYLGWCVVKVEQTPISEAAAIMATSVSQDENPPLRNALVPQYLARGIFLHGSGITEERSRVHYTLADGEGHEAVIELRAVVPRPALVRLARQQPLYRRNPKERFWFVEVPESHAIYCSFRGYQDLASHASALLDAIREKKPDKLVIDMRQNGGGDYTKGLRYLIRPLRELSEINRKGHLFVLVGPLTFSAAMANAAHFRAETNAILAGQTIGEKPNSYAEPREMTLPHSRLVARYSTKFYQFTNGPENVIQPDWEIQPSLADERNGRDPVLECVLQASPDSTGCR